jgi:membrane-associated phospholipid phosphatase
MYFLDKCDQLQRPPRFTTPLQLQAAQLCSLLPFAVALWVAISRTVDYWHHYSDVIAGSLLGFAIAHIRCRWRKRERDTQHARTHGQQDAERHRDSLSLSSLCVYLGVTVYAHACVYGFVLGRSKRQSKRPSTSARFKPITLNPKS